MRSARSTAPQSPTRARRVALIALPAALVLLGGVATAAPGDVEVPNVVGRTVAQARQSVEAKGLVFHVVEIAAGQPGRVHSTMPPAGAEVAPGADVEARVAIALRIETETPDARGKPLDLAVKDLSGAYVIEIERAHAPPEQAGRVVDQVPAPGATLLYRGILRLVVGDAGEEGSGGVVVPSVLGQPEEDAVAALQAVGLAAAVSHVDDPAAPAGTVVSQDPKSGSEIVAGGTVALRVSGQAPPDAPGGKTQVPNVLGTSLSTAQQSLLLAGFVVQADFSHTQDHASWLVFASNPSPGAWASPGAVVKLAVALPMAMPQQLTVPSLIGLPAQVVQQVLGELHLTGQLVSQFSQQPPGTAVSQSPPPGTVVPAGTTVKVGIAKAPPGGWNPGQASVPNVVGRTPAQAFAALLAAGLWPQERTHVAPNAPLHVVDSQQPSAGSKVPPGTKVRFYLPEKTTVPPLIGKTRPQAIHLLQQAGLNAQPVASNPGPGQTVVDTQSEAAGSTIARGSTVAFKYHHVGPPPGQFVSVPNLLGLTKQAATAKLGQKGLLADFQGPQFGLGTTKVIHQNPMAGAHVPPGSVVHVTFVFGGQPAPQVQVPNLLGRTRSAAGALLQQRGLQANFLGPQFGIGATKVVDQTPVPGAMVAPGSVVNVKYVYGGGLQPAQVQVPQTVGKTRAAAKALVESRNLVAQFIGPPMGPGTPRVVAQQPPAGANVPPGTTVKMTIVWQP
jgi:beta-lactam-binding protein with PASTA domain